MRQERFDQIRELFLEACELETSAREAFLGDRCGDDAALREEVASLLGHLDDPTHRDARETRPGDVLTGRYRLLERVGEGGMGEVFRAEDLEIGVPIALKLLREARTGDALAREVRLSREITHPAVCRVHDLGDFAGRPFLTMEYIGGGSLQELLRKVGRLPAERTRELAAELSQGLAAIHRAGVLHRDLKPANVLVDAEGQPKIVDFGIAQLRKGQDGIPIGTPLYMSPEQFEGGLLTERSDLYALGAMLYELMAGHPPFRSDTPEGLREQHRHKDPAPFSGYEGSADPALSALILACLAKHPDDRPRSAQAIARALAAESAPSPPVRTPGTEQRQLTVLCCEIAADEDGDDLERVRARVASIRERAAREVRHWGGHVAGDEEGGFLAYFGFPNADEGAVERALRAGLEACEERQLETGSEAEESTRRSVCVRIGVATGRTLVEVAEGVEMRAVGGATSLARRLAAQAGPNQLLATSATLELVPDRFVADPAFPGTDARRVVAIRPGEAGWRSLREHTPFAGRREELALLGSRLERSVGGEGSTLLIQGEAGIGKSRLIRHLRQLDEIPPTRWLVAHCSPFATASALSPWLRLLEQAAGVDASVAEEPFRHAIVRTLGDAVEQPEDLDGVLALLGIETPGPAAHLEQRLERACLCLAAWLLSGTQEQPLAIVLEDLQWADPSTLAVFRLLTESAPSERLLLIGTHRGEHALGLESRSGVTQVSLRGLTASEARFLASESGPAVGPEELAALISRADGVPLFLEELLHTSLHAPDGLPVVPASLQDLLLARLDRQGEAKPVAQLAAAVGEDFTRKLVEDSWPGPPQVLEASLEALVGGGILHRAGVGSRARYRFRHALVREAAYDTLPRTQRRALHARVLTALEASEHAPPPETLAFHADRAGQRDRACLLYLEAGTRALDSGASQEAQSHLEDARTRIDALGETRERTRIEARIEAVRGRCESALRGYGDGHVIATLERANELAARAEDAEQRVAALFNLFQSYRIRCDPRTEGVLSELKEVAGRMSSHRQQTAVLVCAAEWHLWRGEVPEAARSSEQALVRIQDEGAPERSELFAESVEVNALLYHGYSRYLLGDCASGVRHVAEARSRAEELRSELGIALGAAFAAELAFLEEDAEGSLREAERNLAFALRKGMTYFEGLSRAQLALALFAKHGRGEDVERVEARLGELDGLQVGAYTGLLHARLAAARLARGDASGALEACAGALERIERTSERLPEVDVLRVRGQARIALGEPGEECLAAALAAARSRGVPFQELSAAEALARHWIDSERTGEARTILLEACQRWPEDAKHPALVRARARLASLDRSATD
ncbi:MAG: protein kinase [Myxococcota bacterium]|nr:protein kinase [Myxococcota bacterium]